MAKRTRLRAVPETPLRVADIALFYGERSGGIRTYLRRQGRARGPHRRDRAPHRSSPARASATTHGRHELPSLRVVAANGYRIPLGAGALKETLRALRPDVVLLHDPFWWPVDVIACAREIGARTVAVHHGTSNLEAAALPGPSRVYAPLLRRWLRRSGRHVDAVMSNVDTMADFGRLATMPLRLGVHETFRPRPDVRRGDHVLYVGRLVAGEGRPGAPGGRRAQRGSVAAADRRQRAAGGDAAHPRPQVGVVGARELPPARA